VVEFEAIRDVLKALRTEDVDRPAILGALITARAGKDAAMRLMLAFQRQERELSGALADVGVTLPDELFEPGQGSLVPFPLVAQRFNRVSRQLGDLPLDGPDQPG